MRDWVHLLLVKPAQNQELRASITLQLSPVAGASGDTNTPGEPVSAGLSPPPLAHGGPHSPGRCGYRWETCGHRQVCKYHRRCRRTAETGERSPQGSGLSPPQPPRSPLRAEPPPDGPHGPAAAQRAAGGGGTRQPARGDPPPPPAPRRDRRPVGEGGGPPSGDRAPPGRQRQREGAGGGGPRSGAARGEGPGERRGRWGGMRRGCGGSSAARPAGDGVPRAESPCPFSVS